MEPDTKAMLDCLDNQRAHVVGALDGLTDEALHLAVLPTSWSSVGLVQHLAIDVERFWFRVVVAGETTDENDSSESAWVVSPDTQAADVFDLYRREIGFANDIIANTELDAEPRYWPEFFGDWRLPDLRAILLHVIAETACHAGHLDAARELMDGHTWLILT
ncbi:MAG: DinB family protein, partial [Acidimicrobiales bacterium]